MQMITCAGDGAEKHKVKTDAGTEDENRHHVHHHGLHMRERLRHFLHPNGKRIHVAASPEEALTLRRRLEAIHRSEEFDIYISGSPDHLEALRTAQSHHEDRRDRLRMENQAAFDRFADVHNELDALANELDRVTSHGVSLDAHFSRFGYNAHVKSYDDESPSASGVSTPGGSMSEKQESASERGFATPLKLFKRPTLRQYFHKGILWRASGSEEVQSFELFVDLLYVGILQINGDSASERPDGLSLLYFVITFTLSYKIWNDMSLIISWFETDDVFQRVSVLFLLACVFGYTTNIVEAFEHTYPTLIGFYLAARLFMASYLGLVAFLLPMVRAVMIWNIAIAVIGCGVWIASIHVAWPAQLGLIFAAMAIDLVGSVSYVLVMDAVQRIGGKAKEWFEAKFEFYPAINIEHRTERTNAFVSLVFGYTVIAILYQSTVNGIDAFYGKGVMGLIQCFIFNWMYFEIDSSNLLMHAIRRHKASAFLWSFVHLPFIMSFVLGGAGLKGLVLAHDSTNSHLDELTESYEDESRSRVSDGIRWYYCGGFGLALLCMAAISISHIHKEPEGTRLIKRYRLMSRVAVSIVIICLPLASSLDSVELVGLVTGLLAFLLVTELFAASNANDKLCGRDKVCRYTGRCSKGKLHKMISSGNGVEVDQLISDKEKESGHIIAP